MTSQRTRFVSGGVGGLRRVFLLLLLHAFSTISVTCLSAAKLHNNKALFKFGVIADIQYVNSDDALNFQQTKMRRYRQSLQIYKEAVQHWNRMKDDDGITCAVVLGDLIDGKSSMINTQSECLDDFLAISKLSTFPTLHCFGNHCHYSMTREQLYQHFTPLKQEEPKTLQQSLGGPCRPDKLYYDWSPAPGWRFVCLDGYDVSQIGATSRENALLADTLLKQNNPNDLTASGTWFNNLPFESRRWVPYNGGISKEQLKWLDNLLALTVKRNEKVCIFCHQPVYSPLKPQSLIWNSEEVLEILHKHGNVPMWMAGHDHDGHYGVDDMGIHHLIPPAPLECEVGEKAYGHIEVFSDELVVHWTGKLPTKTMQPMPTSMAIQEAKSLSS